MTIPNATDARMAGQNLPSSKSPNITLDHPTEEERIRLLKLNGASWRGALSLEAYLRREYHLSQQDATRNNGLTPWILVDKTENHHRRVLAGCESFRKKAIIASRGKLTETIAHGVGSVFCPEDFRGRGYAGRMMKELGQKLKTWQNEHCQFSVLFSDIGKTFYAKYDWKPFSSSHISLPATLNCGVQLLHARPLLASDLPELCVNDEISIRKSLKRASSSIDKTFVALVPNIQTIRWHHAREEFVAYELYQEMPEIKGAIIGEETGKRIWCYWTRMWYNEDIRECSENTLHILRLVIEEIGIVEWEKSELNDDDFQRLSQSIAALLIMAQDEAAKWNLENVQFWNPNRITINAAKKLHPATEVIHREEESVCSLRWYGNDQALNNLVWLGNEKYGWC